MYLLSDSSTTAIIAGLMDPIAFVNSALAELAIGTENEVRSSGLYDVHAHMCRCTPLCSLVVFGTPL